MEKNLIALIFSVFSAGCTPLEKDISGGFGLFKDKSQPAPKVSYNPEVISGTIVLEHLVSGAMVKEPGKEWKKIPEVPDRYEFILNCDDSIKRYFVVEGKEARRWDSKYDIGSRVEVPLEYLQEENYEKIILPSPFR